MSKLSQVCVLTVLVGAILANNNQDLYRRAHNGDLSKVNTLLSAGADPNWRNPHLYQESALHAASANNQPAVVRALLDAGASIDIMNIKNETSMSHASHYGHTDAVEALLAGHADLTLADKLGETPLHRAASKNHTDIAWLLLHNGANKRKQNSHGRTPVEVARHHGYIKLANMIDTFTTATVNSTSSTPAPNTNSELELWTASKYGNIASVNQLLALNVCPLWHNPNSAGFTALHVASRNNYPTIVKRLLDAGVDIDLAADGGRTPLYVASWLGSTATVKILIAQGANVDSPRDSGWTPLIAASHSGELDIVMMLIDAGANINQVSYKGRTALHWAAQANETTVAQLLIQKGASTMIEDNQSKTAEDVAREHGYFQLASIIDVDIYGSGDENREYENEFYF